MGLSAGMVIFALGATMAMAQEGAGTVPPSVPGQLSSPTQDGQLLSSGNAVASGAPNEGSRSIASVAEGQERKMEFLWYGSMAAVLGASAFDAASSWHKEEGNPLLASSSGTFGGKAVGIKIGLAAGTLIPQWLLRKHKEIGKVFTITNSAEAAIFTGVAIHNLGIKAPQE